MANIIKVDYNAIPGQANSMKEKGKDLNREFTAAYASISEMHSVWFGVRYNALVKEFNKIIPNLNEILKLVITEVPYALATVANNYAQADTGAKITSATQEAPTNITEIAAPDDVGMGFLTSDVEATQNKVTANFNNAKEMMNQLESLFGQITWESEAATAFKSRFKSLKESIIKSIGDLNTQFTNLMNQTKDDIQRTENSNTVQ